MQVVCRGITTLSGIKRIPSGFDSILEFAIKDSMTPKCQLLVFYFKDREFIGDSYVFEVEADNDKVIFFLFYFHRVIFFIPLILF